MSPLLRQAAGFIASLRRVPYGPIGLHMALLSRPAGARPDSSEVLDGGSDRLLANDLVVDTVQASSPAVGKLQPGDKVILSDLTLPDNTERIRIK